MIKREYKYEWDILYMKCTKCGERKVKDFYWPHKMCSFWVNTRCKDCEKRYREANKIHKAEYDKLYTEKNKERIQLRSKRYYEENKEEKKRYSRNYNLLNSEKRKSAAQFARLINWDEIRERESNYKIRRTQELWFSWTRFHSKTLRFVTKNWLRPSKCPICWVCDKIQIHHPSYEKFDNRKDVVFCCARCHQRIHAWLIECPKPINLLNPNQIETWN